MSLPVHLVDSLAGARGGDVVVVEGDEAHHAVAVRRLREGELVVLTDGLGISATGTIVGTAKRRLEVRLDEVATAPEPTPSVTVVQALPKGDRGELAVEVLTEIGAARIVPWAAERSVAVWKGERAERGHARWSSTAREATKQARRAWHPQVLPLTRTEKVLDLMRDAALAVVLHEEATTPLAGLEVPGEGDVVVVVGPEGGLTGAEVSAFTQAGALSVRLGSEVLRTSTAGVAAVAALLSRTARWTATSGS
ncbi:16S rRNA (uracil(1498)-N(3))-methyltransferase [Nocardioides acrostichi]|uniref:Ribosomal RNA small subunit methyltransferase E n=1 Tax=Nocardioides acrostichi TaxID=2784339 RepID=A0A930UYT4_9ACTN|nr:16S rRNA (uracil(1498)-N(3))-methyltransferase [Nocardioides acrostichi]MBF4163383.1 16S rRNA (uracil(1498)-N(3))-methyltransferase [Nocardioides acrostichi]